MFSIKEILNATQGTLIHGNKEMKINSISIDSRRIKAGELFIAIKGANFDGHDFIKEVMRKKATAVLFQAANLSKVHRFRDLNRRLSFISVPDTVRALGDIARYQRHKFDIPLIAVTGSNGKTTTKEMIACILSSKFKVLKNQGTENNQIGLPLAILKLNKSYDIAVLELGTNHFGEIEYLSNIANANIAVFTNIGPSHLEFFGDLDGIFKEKVQLLRHLRKPNFAILNSDDQILSRNILAKKEFQNGKTIFTFGINKRSDLKAENILFKDNHLEFSLKKEKFILNTLAKHNIYNALAAILVGRLLGLNYRIISSKLKTFKFLTGRLVSINLKNDIHIFDDTYNANPLSTLEALDVLDRIPSAKRKIFIMGDMLELGKSAILLHNRIGERVANSSVNIFFTIGELANFAAEAAIKENINNKMILSFNSKEELNRALLNLVKPCDLILVKGSRAMRMEKIINSLSRSLKV